MSEKPKFATPFAMKCNQQQFDSVKDRLIKMGYYTNTKEYMFDHYGGLYFVTNHTADSYRFGIVNNENKSSGRVLVFEEWNEELCLALASMRISEIFFNGEWTVGISEFNKGKFIKALGFAQKTNSWRKATKEELIEKFSKKGYQ